MQQYGTFRSIELFSLRHGIDAIYVFQNMCNQGAPLSEIATHFGMSIPTVCRLQKLFFNRVFVFHDHVEKYVNFRNSIDESTIKQRKEIIEKYAKVSTLQHIPGHYSGSDSK
jgi:hypothetical protein